MIERAAAGDAAALRTLLERHGPQVWHEIHADIGPQYRSLIDADDVMQVTYMEAFLQLDRFQARDDGSFLAWLRRIARNNLRDAIKELGRKKRPPVSLRVDGGSPEDSFVALIDHLGTSSSTPSRQVATREAAAAISAMLQRLPPDYAKVVRLYDLEGRGAVEVTEAMGRSAGAIHMLRQRAHDRLRAMLGAETDFFTHTA